MDTLNGKNDCSTTLNLIRAIAAQVVCVVHAYNFFYDESPLKSTATVAVMVFFILSGFLIAYTLTQKEKDGFTSYLIDRTSRIYSAYLPAIFFILALDLINMGLHGNYVFAPNVTWEILLGNIFMMENSRWPFSVPQIGSAYPFWTVVIEFHIYVFVGAIYFLRSSKYTIPLVLTAAAFAILPMTHLFGGAFGKVGVGLFSIWLMGFAGYYVLRSRFFDNISTLVLSVLGLGTLAYFCAKIDSANPYDPKLYGLLAVSFLALVAISARTNFISKKVSNVIKVFADYSYSLYLINFTIIYSIMLVWKLDEISGIVFSVLVSNVVAYGFAYLTERNYRKVAQWVKSLPYLLTPRAFKERIESWSGC